MTVALAAVAELHVRGGGMPTELWWSDGERRITYRWDEEAKLADFVNNRWAWLLADVRPLSEPVPCRGAQGLWMAPDAVATAVMAQLAKAVVDQFEAAAG